MIRSVHAGYRSVSVGSVNGYIASYEATLILQMSIIWSCYQNLAKSWLRIQCQWNTCTDCNFQCGAVRKTAAAGTVVIAQQQISNFQTRSANLSDNKFFVLDEVMHANKHVYVVLVLLQSLILNQHDWQLIF